MIFSCILLSALAMPVTDQQFEAWLFADQKARCVPVEAKVYSGGAETARYFSNKPFTSRPADTPANVWYDDILDSIPTFKATLSELFTGISVPSWGDLIVMNKGGALDAWLDDAWDGRSIKIYLGDPSWPKNDFRTILDGVTADIYAPRRDQLALKIRDKQWMLNKPIQSTLIGGTSANANQPVPLAFGQCFNVEPVLVDAATHKYQVHDGQVEDITDVRDSGLSVAFTPSLADGTFTLGASPSGALRVDVKGAKPGGVYLTKCADIIEHIVTTRSDLTSADLDGTNFAAFNAACPQTLGRYVRDRENIQDVFDDLTASLGAFYTFSRAGLMQLGRLEEPAGTPAISLTADDIKQNEIAPIARSLPIATLRLGYKRNFAPQTEGLAGAVAEADRAAFGAEYLVSTASNAGLFTAHKLAQEPDVRGTLLALQADADAEAARLGALWGVVRTTYRATCYMAPYKVALGQVIKVTHPRFGFDAGKLAVVVGFEEQVTRNRVIVDFWA